MTISGATYREGVAYSPDGAMYVTPTGTASITGGTIDGSSLNNGSGIPVIAFKNGIPLIAASTGTITAPGAITLGTALGRIYPRAYCYLPANAVATVAAAGWYYCTFSSTTVGTVFLDTYSGTGMPVIPTSPTAVTDGKGAYTGVTSAISFAYTLPAGTMGANGEIDLWFVTAANNSAGTKLQNPRFGGTNLNNTNMTTELSGMHYYRVANSGNALSQVANRLLFLGTTVSVAGAIGTNFAIDTGAAVTIDFVMTRNTATDNHVLESVRILAYSDGT